MRIEKGRRSSTRIGVNWPVVAAAFCLLAASCGNPIAGEADRLVGLLAVPRGGAIAEIGAGGGELSVAVARRVDRDIVVYSTELGKDRVAALWRAVEGSRAGNIRIVEGSETEAMLPPGGIDAVFMRRVYHHFMRPAEMCASLQRTLRPGGLLAVIEHEPTGVNPRSLKDVLPSRGGDGIRAATLIDELRQAGFVHVRTIEHWDGRLYLALFRRP